MGMAIAALIAATVSATVGIAGAVQNQKQQKINRKVATRSYETEQRVQEKRKRLDLAKIRASSSGWEAAASGENFVENEFTMIQMDQLLKLNKFKAESKHAADAKLAGEIVSGTIGIGLAAFGVANAAGTAGSTIPTTTPAGGGAYVSPVSPSYGSAFPKTGWTVPLVSAP